MWTWLSWVTNTFPVNWHSHNSIDGQHSHTLFLCGPSTGQPWRRRSFWANHSRIFWANSSSFWANHSRTFWANHSALSGPITEGLGLTERPQHRRTPILSHLLLENWISHVVPRKKCLYQYICIPEYISNNNIKPVYLNLKATFWTISKTLFIYYFTCIQVKQNRLF